LGVLVCVRVKVRAYAEVGTNLERECVCVRVVAESCVQVRMCARVCTWVWEWAVCVCGSLCVCGSVR
jgi:hypothetical protein